MLYLNYGAKDIENALTTETPDTKSSYLNHILTKMVKI